MANTIFISILAAASYLQSTSAISLPTRHYTHNDHPANGICTDFTITKSVTSAQFAFAQPPFKDNYDVAGFLESVASSAKIPSFAPLVPPTKPATKDYTISATFCTPKHKNGKEATVLVATSGLGYDKRYWASTYKPEEYSFVGHALDAGYSVFYYDRVGVGKSPKVSGYENQSANQGALLSKIVKDIKAGKWTGNVSAKKVVLVGHSFGSYTSSALIAAEPDLVDGK
jgi:pimeloyl-ACP methyl ester carboxylesterase